MSSKAFTVVLGKIADERFAMLSPNYWAKQKQHRQIISELAVFVEADEQKPVDLSDVCECER